MTLPTLVACLLAVLFFMSGCLQIAIYVGTTSAAPFTAYLPGLLISAWPLAVAAVLFVLVDIRIHQIESSKAEPEIPEAPLRGRSMAHIGQTTYFSTQNYEAARSATDAPAPPPRQRDSRDDLNFFKM